MILITGAAGKTGRAVVKALLAMGVSPKKEPIRALVRRPEQIQALLDLGLQEVVVGDLLSPDVLEGAARGIRAIYHIPPNVNPDEVRIGQGLIQAARSAGVEHFVYHSVLHPQTEAMPHHWQKLRVEELLLTSGLDFTILQPTVYMQNVLAQWDQILNHGVFLVPYAASTRLGMVDLEDVAAAAAVVLLENGHQGAIYELCGSDVLSQEEVAAILAQVTGRVVRVEIQPKQLWEQQALASGLGEYQVSTLLKMFEYYEQYGFWGNPQVLGWLLKRQPDSFQAFIQRVYSSINAHSQ
jgi:NAD(P)H dehydrogenase (quinone)